MATADPGGALSPWFPKRSGLLTGESRAWLAAQAVPVAAREQITVALAMLDALDLQMAPIEKELCAYARRQTGCKALMAHYGIGEEAGERPQSRSSPSSVTAAGSPPPAKRSATPGWTSPCTNPTRAAHQGISLARGPPALRWALYEVAQVARRDGSPDRDYYTQAAERLGGNRACLAVARKLLKRSHILRDLGEEALQPA